MYVVRSKKKKNVLRAANAVTHCHMITAINNYRFDVFDNVRLYRRPIAGNPAEARIVFSWPFSEGREPAGEEDRRQPGVYITARGLCGSAEIPFRSVYKQQYRHVYTHTYYIHTRVPTDSTAAADVVTSQLPTMARRVL